MNLEFFIIKRLIKSKEHKSNISASIIKIAITAIAIGTIVMLITIATGIGLQKKIREKLSTFNGHIQISNYDNNQSETSLIPILKNVNFYPKFYDVPEVTHIQAVAKKAGIIRTENTFEGIIFKGINKNYKTNNFKDYIIEGRFPKIENKINNEILISEHLANRLSLKLNDKFNTYFLKDDVTKKPNLRVFKIVGIYNSGLEQIDKSLIIGHLKHIQLMNKWTENQIGNFEIFVDDFNKIDEITQKVYENTPSNLNTINIKQKYFSIFEWLKMFDFNIVLILTLMLIVCGFNMITALLVLILDRTQMIGILKALGSSNYSIRKIFLYNAIYLIIKGLVYGNLMGLILIFIQYYFEPLTLNPEDYYVNSVPVYLSFSHWLILNLGIIFLCFLMLLLPSYLISKTSPVKAIRFT